MTKINSDIFGENAPEIIKDLALRAKVMAIKDYQMSEEEAEQFGIAIALKIGDEWGGSQIYIPTSIALKMRQQEIDMYKKFNGCNHAELAKEYHCSVVWVYAVIRRLRKQLQDKQQPQLPL